MSGQDHELELSNGCWTAPATEVRVGDVCHAVVLPITEAEPKQEPEPPYALSLDAYSGFGLVLKVFHRYALLAPIVIVEITKRPDQFKQLLDAARYNPTYVKLPELGGAWESPALALLYKPHTVPTSELTYRRSAAMTPEGSVLLARRVALAFAP